MRSYSGTRPIQLSLVIPAYNESKRLPTFLRAATQYLERVHPAQYEIVVVDDGSSDNTRETASQILGAGCITPHAKNRGKGAAVQTGIQRAKGELILIADADGATPIAEEKKLREAILKGADIAIGSRALGVEKRKFRLTPHSFGEARLTELHYWEVLPHRYLTGRVFAWLVRSLLGIPFQDTQCGFKMFRRGVAQSLFSELQASGYTFDVEVLLRAKQRGFQINEVAVRWHDVKGSRVRLVRDSVKMMMDLWKMRRLKKGIVSTGRKAA